MSNPLAHDHAAFIKKIALGLGFESCGISRAVNLESEESKLEQWLNEKRHGEMAFMAQHFRKRLDPTVLVEGAKSVISLIYNYFPEKEIFNDNAYKIARYAYGNDYHQVIKKKLNHFITILREKIGDFSGRAFVDSAPVMERQWASRSGLGWTGKNTLLLNPKIGSYFFLAELIVDLALEPDSPISDHCGSCTRCIDACPTQALTPYLIDAAKCISYLTIELKGKIPDEFNDKYGNWIFGCDICQEVCPWNRFSKPHQEPEFEPVPGLESMEKKDWEEMTAEAFQLRFKKSPLQRTKYEGIKRNLAFIKNESL